jgi:ABC-type antimicrobial peptide transport system permease subunit
MTTPQNLQPANSSPNESVAQPFLSLHTTVVLLAALVIGLVIGGLTALTGASVAAAVIAGLTSAGASAPVLRTLIR